MNFYSQLSLEERYTLSSRKAKGIPMSEIARDLGRHVSTLYRELQRNLRPTGLYAASVAHSYAVARNHRAHRGSHFTQAVYVEVLKQVQNHQWSPEQVHGRRIAEGKPCMSVPTIYRWIKKNRKKGGNVFENLRIYPKVRRKRYGSIDFRGKLANKRSIEERPVGAIDRSELGHWEVDTVMGSNRFECVLTLVDRKAGIAEIAKIRHRTAKEVTAALVKIIRKNPDNFKTLTFDNGTEFHSYKQLERKTNLTCYFARPHHPWERGSNENFNGLLRQYLPKGASMAGIGNSKLDKIVKELNHRPRKRLAFKTPWEVFYGC